MLLKRKGNANIATGMDGKLDAICVAKWENEDLVFRKEYREVEIAELIIRDFLSTEKY